MYLSLLIVLSVTVTAKCANSSFDISTEFQLNQPPRYSLLGRSRCQNTAAFGLLGSLEIAYTRATGVRRKFSEQEIVDCYWRGCTPTSLSELVTWLRTVDRLAPYDKYTPFLARSEMCRAKTAPDGLDKIKIHGIVKVTVENVEEMIRKYGSVIACYDTDKSICPALMRYTGGIIEGYESNICRQYVVIVGFTSSYYRVREARGPTWGDDGYFLIKRGGNDCGIEHNMVALVTEIRSDSKLIASNGCPLEFPKYCESAKTCAKNEQECITEEEEEEEEKHNNEDEQNDKKEGKLDRDSTGAKCNDNPKYNCAHLIAYCKIPKVKAVCAGTCKVCKSKCVDDSEHCYKYKHVCHISDAVKIKCARTCGLQEEQCGTLSERINNLVKAPEGTKGKCNAPEVANGVVLNGDMLEYGELLKIECERGYVLTGVSNKCVVQNLYAPDSRMVQTCVKDGGEKFNGRGMDYSGVKNTAVDGTQCSNWYKVTLRGYNRFSYYKMKVERVQELAIKAENHNFCRNYDSDQPVPYCYVDGTMKYCFPLPGCDERCGNPINQAEECEETPYENCYYRNWNQKNLPDFTWKYCTRTCCEAAGCLKTLV